MNEPRWSPPGPETVPEANRSPVRRLAPLTVMCASCWAGVQYSEPNGGQLTSSLYWTDRKSTRLNSSHANISYAVFCLKKKKNNITTYNNYHHDNTHITT